MTSWQSNITPRPSVYSFREMRHETRESRSQGSDETWVEMVRSKIEEWPPPLKKLFCDCEKTVRADNEWSRISKVLLKLKGEKLQTIYYLLIQECIDFRGNIISVNYSEEADFKNKQKKNNTGVNYVMEANFKNKQKKNNTGVNYVMEANFKNIQQRKKLDQTIKESNLTCITYISFFIFGLMAIFYFKFSWEKEDLPFQLKIEEWTHSIRNLQEKFPSQNEYLWSDIVSGVKTIVTEEPTKPGVLLLLHNDKRTSACLASKVGQEAVKLLSNTLQEPIVIRGEDIKLNKSLTKDFGLFTQTHKHDIEKKHVMIVLDLQEIPGVLAQTFHVLCDVENPLVRDAVFLFTMQVDVGLQNPTAIAEENLKLLWKDTLDIDIMDPLITRITDAVVSVNMEAHLPC